MTFWQIFVRVLPSRPVDALKALWWHLTGRRVRARNRLRAAGSRLPFAYQAWIRHIERAHEVEESAAALSSAWAVEPRFSIVLQADSASPECDVSRTIRSVRRQIYPHWKLFVAGPHAPTISEDDRVRALKASKGAAADAIRIANDLSPDEFIVLLKADHELAPWALFRFAEALQSHPDAKLMYGDQDEIDSSGRRNRPWFKPRWNEEMFLAQDFISDVVAIRSGPLSDLDEGAVASPHALVLGIVRHQGEGAIVHVPHVVAHRFSNAQPVDQQSRLDAISAYLVAHGATASAGPFNSVKVSWPLPERLPLVSIIVPTKDRLDLLRPCVEGVLSRTHYEPLELLIVDNGSIEGRTEQYLTEIIIDPRVRVLRYPGPYNYSAINNLAVKEAKGAFVCLLNNDTEIVETDWLREMVRYAVRPEVGAVGAKLLYADRTIQHAGVVVGIGDAAGHAHRNLPDDEAGYFAMPHVAQFVSAVTAACLVVSKEKFLSVGGLDEKCLAVAFNDVDLCLKLGQAGWRNVYVPHAVLIHHESKSRGKDHSPSQIDRYRVELRVLQERWETKTFDDPQFSPNLDRSSETFLIRL